MDDIQEKLRIALIERDEAKAELRLLRVKIRSWLGRVLCRLTPIEVRSLLDTMYAEATRAGNCEAPSCIQKEGDGCKGGK